MINLQTYRLEPCTAADTRTGFFTTEWLRDAVNTLMRVKRDVLDAGEVYSSLFYNHDPVTGRTRQGYPLVIYHSIDGTFFITGINEGANTLNKLVELYQEPFLVEGIGLCRFKKEKVVDEFNLGCIGQFQNYSLVEWRPIHHTQRAAFIQLSMMGKVAELQHRLEKHLINELGKYLNSCFEGLKLEITDITRVYEPAMFKMHKYPAFDIRFSANVLLPAMITLGNHQSLGYGRVVPL